MVLKHIGVLSAAKIAGATYAILGLLFGALFSLIAVAGSAFQASQGNAQQGLVGALFGVGAIIVLPIFYGVLGFICAAIGAALYNWMAHMLGGVELHLE